MKFFIVSVIVSTFALGTAFAQDRSNGCGMGWRVTKSMTTSASYTRALTNATFSNTLAMTSGTSGCARHDLVLNEKSKIHFIESNLIPLQYEVAVGSGERLEAAGVLFGCQQSMTEFKAALKSNSSKIFGGDNSASNVKGKVEEVISTDKNLSSSCII